jgi:hypothetical protein
MGQVIEKGAYLYITTWGPSGRLLYRFDGQQAVAVSPLPSGGTYSQLIEHKGKLFLARPYEIWEMNDFGQPTVHNWGDIPSFGSLFPNASSGLTNIPAMQSLASLHGKLYIANNRTGTLYVSGTVPSGDYVSQPHQFVLCFGEGRVHFEATMADGLPANALRIQVRSAHSAIGLASASFVGPDGTTNTSYTVSGQAMPPVHANHHFFQYRVFMVADAPARLSTPVLEEVSLEIEPPATGSNYCEIGEFDIGQNGSTIRIESVPGEIYTLQYSPSLVAPQWINVQSQQASSGDTSFIDPFRSADGYYRVRTGSTAENTDESQ